jgi:hypothetical protein
VRVLPGVQVQGQGRPVVKDGSKVKCTLDCDAHTFAYSAKGGASVVVLRGLPAGRVLYPAVSLWKCGPYVRMLDNYSVLRIRLVVRTRAMCQAGRARAADARGDVATWLCERAPLWVAVHVCMLLRDD